MSDDILQSHTKFDGVGLHAETIETRARIGEAYLEAYDCAITHPALKGYAPADCPSELLLDMLLSLTEGRPIDTAPRDGTLFDMTLRGRRYIDCKANAAGQISREHGYPAVTTMFGNTDGATWLPRPEGLLQPYEVNAAGEKYVP